MGLLLRFIDVQAMLELASESAGHRYVHSPPLVTGHGSGPRRIIEPKHMNAETFSGAAEDFDEWAWQLKRLIKTQAPRAFDLKQAAEMQTGMTEEKLTGLDAKCSAEVYDVLCAYTRGEALAIVRGTEDMGGCMAWNRLHVKHAPKTMARAIKLVSAVTCPTTIANMTDVETKITEWEDKVKLLHKHFNETFSDLVKIGIVTSMLPMVLQVYVCTTLTENAVYEDVVARIRSVAHNKATMSMGPASMDVGFVRGGERCHDETDEPHGDIDAVNMNTQCNRCKGWGHFARDCATKGRGKGAKGDDGKGGKSNLSFSGKGKGKGQFNGKCHNCQQWGHRAFECRSRAANAVEEDVGAVAEEAEVGGVWMIGAVAASPGLNTTTSRPNVSISNRFDILTEPDDGAQDVDVDEVGVQCKWSRPSGLDFNVADVKRPLASAAKVVRAGNRVVMDEDGSYIENKVTGEKIKVRIDKETFVFDVKFDDGEQVTITLDSGAGCNVWPKELLPDVPMRPKSQGLKMTAANGTEILNYGCKLIKFRGVDASSSRKPCCPSTVFTRQAAQVIATATLL